jgi:hypothetical protein
LQSSVAVRAHCIRIKRLLANTTRFLAGEISAADADDDAKADFLEVVNHAHFANRLEVAVSNDPALVDLNGTAIWTKVAKDDVEAKLAERAKLRLEEEDFRRKDLEQEIAESKDVANGKDAGEPKSPSDPNDARAKPTISQEDVATTLQNYDERLKKLEGKGCCTVA